MTVAGVTKINFPGGETVSITIDDAKTSTPVIIDALKNGGYSSKETPVMPPDGK